MSMSPDEAMERFKRQKNRAMAVWFAAYDLVYVPWLILGFFIDEPLPHTYQLVVVISTGVLWCYAPIHYYRGRRCPNCRKANLFLGPEKIHCRGCGIQLLDADESKGQWRMMLGLGVPLSMLPVVLILVLAFESRPVWLAAMFILLFVVMFIAGPFLIHKYHRKFT